MVEELAFTFSENNFILFSWQIKNYTLIGNF